MQEQDEEDEEDEGNQGFADASTFTAGRGCTRCRERVRRREDGTGEEMRNALGLASAWERRVRSTEKTPPL